MQAVAVAVGARNATEPPVGLTVAANAAQDAQQAVQLVGGAPKLPAPPQLLRPVAARPTVRMRCVPPRHLHQEVPRSQRVLQVLRQNPAPPPNPALSQDRVRADP